MEQLNFSNVSELFNFLETNSNIEPEDFELVVAPFNNPIKIKKLSVKIPYGCIKMDGNNIQVSNFLVTIDEEDMREAKDEIEYPNMYFYSQI